MCSIANDLRHHDAHVKSLWCEANYYEFIMQIICNDARYNVQISYNHPSPNISLESNTVYLKDKYRDRKDFSLNAIFCVEFKKN